MLHNIGVWQSEAFRTFMADGKLWLGVYALLIFLVLHYSLRFFRQLYAEYAMAGRSDIDGDR